MIKILFVCYANICRSPALQAVFESLVIKHKLEREFFIDSCGISPHFCGRDIEPHMQEVLKKRGYVISHKARVILNADFQEFDYILTISEDLSLLLKTYTQTEEYQKKICKVTKYSQKYNDLDIPDPYNQGPETFEQVVDIAEEVAVCLFNAIMKK